MSQIDFECGGRGRDNRPLGQRREARTGHAQIAAGTPAFRAAGRGGCAGGHGAASAARPGPNRNRAAANWRSAQFDRYENLKAAGAIDLTGDILTLHIEGELARALVREDRHGIAYAWLWFYRRGEGGWRHIAQYFDFWGEAQATNSKRLIAHYRDADEGFAEQLVPEVSAWLDEQCADTGCPETALVVHVLPDMENEVAWRNADGGRLQLRSPYVDIARADSPFDAELANRVYALLSENWLKSD